MSEDAATVADGAPIVAIFDFDHTLTTWDTAARFFVWLLRRQVWRMSLLVLSTPVLAPCFLWKSTRRWPIHFSIWLATLRITDSQLLDLARQHVAEVKAGGRSFVRGQARQQLAAHICDGHQVVIASGSLKLLVDEILLAEDIHGVTVVASTLKARFGGMVSNEHCFGRHKIPMLQRRGFMPPWDYAYSDHSADLPLLNFGKQRFLVNPQPRCAARLRRALGSQLVILDWGSA